MKNIAYCWKKLDGEVDWAHINTGNLNVKQTSDSRNKAIIVTLEL